MTTPGPRLNNESEPMFFLFLFCFFNRAMVCHITCSCLSLQFPTCPEWSALQRCHGKKEKKKMSGFAMPCDLRKKAALTNFLRDIRWCLMFVFVSVVPLFFFFFLFFWYWPYKNLNSVNCLSITQKDKTNQTERMVCTIVALFCFVAFDKKKKSILPAV